MVFAFKPSANAAAPALPIAFPSSCSTESARFCRSASPSAAAPAAPVLASGAPSALDAALAAVCAKLEQCTAQLSASSSAQESEQLVRIIGASAQTVRELRAAGAR